MARMSWILRAYQIDLSIKTMPQLLTNCLATFFSKLPSSVNFMIIRTWTKPEKLIQVPAPRCILRHDTGDAFQTAEVMRSHKIPGHGRARPLPCGDFITSNLGIDSRNRWKFRKIYGNIINSLHPKSCGLVHPDIPRPPRDVKVVRVHKLRSFSNDLRSDPKSKQRLVQFQFQKHSKHSSWLQVAPK